MANARETAVETFRWLLQAVVVLAVGIIVVATLVNLGGGTWGGVSDQDNRPEYTP